MVDSGRPAPSRIPRVDERELARASLPGAAMDPASARLLAAEGAWLQRRREAAGLPAPSGDDLAGIALSGGGIRSATFALGALQALAKRDLLRHFDYVSTVSGGGYLGTALTWWWSGRSGKLFGQGPDSFPYGSDSPSVWRGRVGDGSADGPLLLTHLRKHGNYLTPGEGLGRLSLASVVLRGAIINLAVWLPVLIVVMLVLQGALRAFTGWPLPVEPDELPVLTVPSLALFLEGGFAVAVFFLALTALYCRASIAAPDSRFWALVKAHVGRPTPWWLWAPALTLLVLVLVAWRVDDAADWAGLKVLSAAAGVLIAAFACLALAYSVLTGLVYWLGRRNTLARVFSYDLRRAFETWAGFFFALTGGLLVLGAVPYAWQAASGAGNGFGLPGAGTGGALAMLAGFASSVVAFLKSGRQALATVGGKSARLPERLSAGLAAALFLFGTLLLAYDIAHRCLEADAALGVGLVLVAWAGLFGFVCDLNHVSVHRMYRDRLMEAFMPSYEGARQGFTGAAPDEAERMRLHEANPEAPYPIINANVVLVNALDRRRRMRGGDNFSLSPLYCGSNATGWCPTRAFMGGNMTLATAMAISGAAAHPNTGVGGVGLARSRAVAAVMALFNLRLGYWVPHPNRGNHDTPPTPDEAGPPVPNQFYPGLCAFLPCGHHEGFPHQELSDGGHFENLGLYELIRRRVRLILLSDAGCDPGFMFQDLQTALRRIGADFGARIDLDADNGLERLILNESVAYPPATRLAERGYISGRVTYADGSQGVLILLKSTLVPRLRLELLGYRGANPEFPDETTVDQFFDEDQFEAYRELGYRIAQAMLDDQALDLAGRLARLHAPAAVAALAVPAA